MNEISFEPPDVVILSHPRSGTHFLSSALASHPKVHTRDECILNYQECLTNSSLLSRLQPRYIFINKPDCLNLAIVMYNQIKEFERLCGSLSRFKLIHLLRDPEQVARSIAVLTANKQLYGPGFRAHYHFREVRPPDAPHTIDNLAKLKFIIAARQMAYTELLEPHADKLIVHYEQLTNNRQVRKLPELFCREVLKFLSLDYSPLRTNLVKTGNYEPSP